MSKKIKTWLIAAGSLVILGLIMFAAAMTFCKWDFTRLSTAKYETNTYQVNEKFSNISLKTDTADVSFVPSDDGKCKVVCCEPQRIKNSVSVKDNTLSISSVDERKWYDYIGINFKASAITVYLPQGEYGSLSLSASTGNTEIAKDFNFKSIDISKSTGNVANYASASDNIKIKTSTGKIRVENISAGTLDLSATTGDIAVSDVTCEGDFKINLSTGKVNIENVKCESVISSGTTGDISLKNVIAEKKYSIKRTTGDVKLDGCDAAEISVNTNTGNVSGTLLSEKVFLTDTQTGKVDVPKTASGGKCELTTSTGNIKIDITA